MTNEIYTDVTFHWNNFVCNWGSSLVVEIISSDLQNSAVNFVSKYIGIFNFEEYFLHT